MNFNDLLDILQNKTTYGNYNIIVFIDAIIFLLFSIAVLYLFIFALAAQKKKYSPYPPADINHRFILLFPAYKADAIILNSVTSLFNQQYPKECFDIVVACKDMKEDTISRLQDMSVITVISDHSDDTKTSLIQYATCMLPPEAYDMIVILDANNTVSPDFLTKINDAYYSGCQVVQTHRQSKDIQTDIEALTALIEEINNAIFRKGHVRLGFSSALISSGMAFDYDWFRKHIFMLDKKDFDKPIEAMLFKEYIYIDYLENVYTYDKKVSSSSDFYEQRRRWASADSGRKAIWNILKALINENWDYADKLFQWLMPSRLILLGLLFLFSAFIFIIDWALAIKWFVLCLIMLITMSICIPDRMITKRFQRAIILAPLLFVLSILGRFKRNS